MTIELKNVMKKVRLGPVKTTYDDLNIRIEEKSRMALLGGKTAGLEAIVNLICAADAPDKGVIRRTHSISWAIPGTPHVHKHHPLISSARFLARLYDVDEKDYLIRVLEMADIGDAVNLRADKCPKAEMSRFLFSAGICLPFDQYVLTNVNVGGKDDRPRFAEIVEELGRKAGILLVTQDAKTAQKFCTEAYVFDKGQATYFDDMAAAAEYLRGVDSKEEDEEDFFDSDPELENLINVDF
jgi:capsular polysaccharide transport system ATP-binding protein